LSTAKGAFFLGTIIGLILLGMMADNIGRRISLLVCLVCGLVGLLFILLASKLFVAEIGLFLVGFGL